MSADDAIMTLHRQIDEDAAPYLRLAYARGEGCEIVLFVDKKGKAVGAEVKVKPGKKADGVC